jgi:RNA polymerase sigma factor (sigma-70 family)
MTTAGTDRLVGARGFAYTRALREVDPPSADDVAQEAICRLLRQDPQPANLEAWLTTVVRNLVIDLHRKGDRRAHGAFGGMPSERSLQRQGYVGEPVSGPALDRMEIGQALDCLRGQERHVLELHLAGRTNQEIADRFGYASTAVAAVTLSRAKRRVRAALRPAAGTQQTEP